MLRSLLRLSIGEQSLSLSLFFLECESTSIEVIVSFNLKIYCGHPKTHSENGNMMVWPMSN